MQHLRTVGMTYWQHLVHAWAMGWALIVHGVFPFWFETYASDRMRAAQRALDERTKT